MQALTVTVVLYALVLAAVLAVGALRDRDRGPRTGAALLLVQGVTTLLVVVDALRAFGGRLSGADLVTHVGYLVTAVVVLPVAASTTGDDRGRWGSAALAFACLLLAVVLVRTQQTARA